MKVRATNEYKKRNLSDAILGRIPKAGEIFEVTEERFNMLHGNNSYKAIFVEKVEKPVKEVETAKKKTTTRKAAPKTTKKTK